MIFMLWQVLQIYLYEFESIAHHPKQAIWQIELPFRGDLDISFYSARMRSALVVHHLSYCKHQTNSQNYTSKCYHRGCYVCLPASRRKLNIAKRRQNVCQSACARCADQLKDRPEIA